MQYLKTYTEHLLLESTKHYVTTHNIDKEVVNKIQFWLSKMPNLVYNFLKFYNEDNIKLESDDNNFYSSIKNMIDYILTNRVIITSFLPKNLQQYKTFENLSDDLVKIQDKIRIKKELFDKVNTRIKKNVKDLSDDETTKLIYYLDNTNLFTPFVRFKTYEEFLNHITDVINNTNVDNKSYETELKSWTKHKDVELIFDQNNVLVFRTINPLFIKKYGSKKWCIVYDMSKYFKQYINPRTGNTQYLIFNLNYDLNHKNAKFGITIDEDGKPLSGACQNNFNENLTIEKVLDLNNIPPIIVPYTYSKEILDTFDYLYELASGNKKLTSEDITKYKDYILNDYNIIFNNLEHIKTFIDLGLDVNIKNDYDTTILHIATDRNDLEMVKYLVENGADVNVKHDDGYTPLYNATDRNDLEMVKYLVENGADVNVKSKYGYTPLYNATERNNLEMVKYLVENGADCNIKDLYIYTPLHVATDRNNLEIVKYLVENGADVNVKNNFGYTPLLMATNRNDLEIVKYLVENGADVNVKNKNGKLPIDLTISQEIKDYLKNT